MSNSEGSTSPFAALGGEPGVRALVDTFYDLMSLEGDYAHLRALHAPNLGQARDKLFWYLCGWLGGPAHYEQRFGHPRLRARHMPYAIDSLARDQWLGCMAQAMDTQRIPAAVRATLWPALEKLADWMRNQPD